MACVNIEIRQCVLPQFLVFYINNFRQERSMHFFVKHKFMFIWNRDYLEEQDPLGEIFCEKLLTKAWISFIHFALTP